MTFGNKHGIVNVEILKSLISSVNYCDFTYHKGDHYIVLSYNDETRLYPKYKTQEVSYSEYLRELRKWKIKELLKK